MTSQFGSLLLVDLSQQVLDITLDSVIVHGRQNRLNRLGLGKLIKLMATMNSRQLKNQGKTKSRIVLYEALNVTRLHEDNLVWDLDKTYGFRTTCFAILCKYLSL